LGFTLVLLAASNVPTWVGFAVVVVIVGGWLLIQSLLKRQRTTALISVAQQIGFNFQGKEWNGPQSPQLQTALFRQGRSKEFRNIMAGSAAGYRAFLFDYCYVVGSGRSRRNIVQTVAAYSKNGISLPEFAMQPKGVLQKIGQAFVNKDINFDSHPDFSRRCQLRSPDGVRTRALFTPAVISYLESLDPKKKWCFEGMNDTLLMFRRNKRVKPEDFPSYLEESSAIATSVLGFSGAKGGVS